MNPRTSLPGVPNGPHNRGVLENLIGLYRAAPFTREFFASYVQHSGLDSYDAALGAIGVLAGPFDAVRFRYCQTLADELVRLLRGQEGKHLGPFELASVARFQHGVDLLRAELFRRLHHPLRAHEGAGPWP